MKIDAVMKYSVSRAPCVIHLYPTEAIEPLVYQLQESNHSQQVRAIISRPYREKSTGKYSQLNHIWGHITAIAKATGDSVDDVEHYAKVKAISRGYPYHISRLTNEMRPDSMSTISSEAAVALIDTLHNIAADLGVYLPEGE
jgi:hypothetical protein